MTPSFAPLDYTYFLDQLRADEMPALNAWAETLPAQIAQGLNEQRYGDLPRWRTVLEQLPTARIEAVDLRSDAITVRGELPTDAQLEKTLQGLHPWRKGPFDLFGVYIDTEWRSDWKWQRLAPHIQSLAGRRVLDIGCGSGYHCWRMRGEGAALVVGVDPTPLFICQFFALQHYIRDPHIAVLPLGIEHLPAKLRAFDSVFSMGVLYHRRSPFDHLMELRDTLRSGGELILETLVIDGALGEVLVPRDRYAMMGNVWFLPSVPTLIAWMEKIGFQNVRSVDVNTTRTDEQRSTEWMRFHSLANFLDPQDASKTVEAYPAPKRAIVIAEAP